MPQLISDLAVMLLTAGIVTVIFRKIRQPMVLGYILAGFLVGPYMPYFFTVADQESIEIWSEIGIIVLMFGLGLEFNLHKLFSTGKTAVITALTEVLGMLLIGFLTGRAMGWGNMDSLFLGGMLSMSSTTIIIKAFDELNVKQESFAQLVFGILVIEDIAGIFMMIILSTVSASKNISGFALASQLSQLVIYLILWLVLGIFILPTILKKASDFLNDETLLLLSLGICFGMVLLADALGFSSALGAFLAGSLLAGTIHAERTEHLTSGIRDLFGAVFFLSVGMLIDPAMIVKYAFPILVITIVTIFGKILISSLGVLLSGQGLHKAVRCGCCLGQIGEFAFIIASLGLSLGVIADFIYPVIVSVSVITTLTTPTLIKSSDKVYELLVRILPAKLTERIGEYTDEDDNTDAVSEENDNRAWTPFLRRYALRTAFYGVLMLGVSWIAGYVIFPFLRDTSMKPIFNRLICILTVVLGDALFIRPMLDLHSSEYTALWVADRRNRLPLISLNVLRFILVALIIYAPVQHYLHLNPVLLLAVVMLTVVLIYRSGWMAGSYIKAETQFLANLNERVLNERDQTGNRKALEKALGYGLFVSECVCGGQTADRQLKQLNWGRAFNVNIILVRRGQKTVQMPSGDFILREGDRITMIGKKEDLQSICTSLGLPADHPKKNLHEFLQEQEKDPSALYTYMISAQGNPEIRYKSIRDSRLRDKYDCMILGLLREKMPVMQPDVNMILEEGDLIWILGSEKMAECLLIED
ncbi:MAG: cation:proton antiporter [Lachnospiraceae bacterium]|nr:cation:proton antiporter [Lachnospiraceae bacterium]